MNIEFIPMNQSHLELWQKWQQVPHVRDSWFIGGYEPAEYMEKKLDGNGYDYPFIIMVDKKAFGFLQCCDLYAYRTTCPKPKGVFCHEDEGTYCLDLFIADENNLGKGIGTKIVDSFVKKLLSEFNAKKILIDPSAKNKRAIRCYEKAGFKKIRKAHDGTCEVIVMQWFDQD
ncbi:MAG: GNAT family N-acetyltransferase [Myxococcales bacterium]|nr:GNAT family N-acetyltransferase [Myxococcales bacterium]USN51614.1 MAG: GNAT family N-acetyltransferase [Myxococcales bacterium]